MKQSSSLGQIEKTLRELEEEQVAINTRINGLRLLYLKFLEEKQK